jgi:Vitamin K-dependent gamma-carboxylase
MTVIVTPVTGEASLGDRTTDPLLTRDVHALSLFRIALSLALLFDFLLNDLPHFQDLYGLRGVLPPDVHIADTRFPSVAALGGLFRIADALQTHIWFPSVYVVTITWFLVGYRTRLASLVLLVLTSYLCWRNPFVTTGTEVLTRLLLLWCVFLPLGCVLSVDARRRPATFSREPAVLPFIALRWQLCSIYLFAGLFKLQGAPWKDGSAVSLTLRDTLFGNTPVGNFLVDQAPRLLYGAGFLIIGFQLILPLLLYSPWRNDLCRGFALVGAATLHVSFLLCLQIGAFPVFSLIALLLLVPDAWTDRLLARREQGRMGSAETCQIADGAAVGRPARHSRWYRAMQTSPWRRKPGHSESTHATVGGLRSGLRASSSRTRGLTQRCLEPMSLALCFGLMVLATVGNVTSVLRSHHGTPKLSLERSPTLFDRTTIAFLVRQSWDLFAPVPVHYVWNYRIEARFDGPPPANVIVGQSHDGLFPDFPGVRWRKFLSRFADLDEAEWSALGNYFCRKFKGAGILRSVEIAISTVSLSPAIRESAPAEMAREFACAENPKGDALF